VQLKMPEVEEFVAVAREKGIRCEKE
jgi:hypothetical protein